MSPEDPVVNAMLLCDHVHRDPTTGKHTLLGVLDTLRLPFLPAVLEAAAFYLSLTNLRGTYRLELAWLRGDTEEELARLVRTAPTVMRDPLARVELALRIPAGLPVPVPGRYILRFYANSRLVKDLAIIVARAAR